MSEHGRSGRHPRSTPSQAIGESGDEEARREADRAVVEDRQDTDRQDSGGRDLEGHSAKRQRPGIGREEQIHPHPRGRRPDRESDDR
ncbi:hypothetical protein J7F03_16530 [Streptomyces sp. ISL-43]|uniref:hypothetical protein n=1 Tax=Streptomyces sp. ISL-43 TaxID=2819183 RepID=UPI001BEA2C80|nr:hypothetical protein [Streptomyces sp. ISL-43]MBT2448667.1 hypothetical protein [Streptomyces sp. ISL-43]